MAALKPEIRPLDLLAEDQATQACWVWTPIEAIIAGLSKAIAYQSRCAMECATKKP
jgi:hypothetical protein